MCVWLRLEIQCSHPEGGWELMEALTCSGQNPSVNFLPFFFAPAVDIWSSFSSRWIFTVIRCGICACFSSCVHICGSTSCWEGLDR